MPMSGSYSSILSGIFIPLSTFIYLEGHRFDTSFAKQTLGPHYHSHYHPYLRSFLPEFAPINPDRTHQNVNMLSFNQP